MFDHVSVGIHTLLAVRAGQDPKEYINSVEGVLLRMRGIKGAVLLPASKFVFATPTTN